ncbi:MAG: FliJ family protein [Peptococcaceae bacterium]|jgi:flagellar FliJ protein|nr:FliJ family protein [Peptococcaceae bacterium]
MAFKFRLETSLRLAKQELDMAQNLLAQQIRILLELRNQSSKQALLLERAWQGQRTACREAPSSLGLWQKYAEQQKKELLELNKKVEKQQKIVDEYRKELLECRIKVEKYERLKAKQKRLFYIEELRTEQKQLDEIAQTKGRILPI